MYRAIVRARVKAVYEQMNAGDLRGVVMGMAEDVRHYFPGTHALAGEQVSRDAYERWLQRVTRLLPDLHFEVRRVASTGGPWNTWATAEWVDYATLPEGRTYRNRGVTCVNIRWGLVREIREYMDTDLVVEACAHLAENGMPEAAAGPLVD